MTLSTPWRDVLLQWQSKSYKDLSLLHLLSLLLTCYRSRLEPRSGDQNNEEKESERDIRVRSHFIQAAQSQRASSSLFPGWLICLILCWLAVDLVQLKAKTYLKVSAARKAAVQ